MPDTTIDVPVGQQRLTTITQPGFDLNQQPVKQRVDNETKREWRDAALVSVINNQLKDVEHLIQSGETGKASLLIKHIQEQFNRLNEEARKILNSKEQTMQKLAWVHKNCKFIIAAKKQCIASAIKEAIIKIAQNVSLQDRQSLMHQINEELKNDFLINQIHDELTKSNININAIPEPELTSRISNILKNLDFSNFRGLSMLMKAANVSVQEMAEIIATHLQAKANNLYQNSEQQPIA